MSGGISETLRPYVPASLFQADGTTLKPGISDAQAKEVAKGVQARAESLPPAEAKMFLSMVNNADLAPGGRIPADIDKALETFSATASRISSLSISSGALDFLARAMIEQSAEQRKNALNDRLAAREQAKGELLSQAGKMREEADKLSSSALTSMIVSVVMASVSIAAGAISVGASVAGAFKGVSAAKDAVAKTETAAGAAAKAGDAAPKFVDGSGKFVKSLESMGKLAEVSAADKGVKLMGALGSISGTISQSANQLGGSVSGFVSTTGQADAKRIEADGQVDAAQAQEQQAIGDVRKEQQQALDQMVQSIIQFLKDLKDAKAEQMRAFTRV